MSRKTLIIAAAIVGAPMLGSGCVQQERYDSLLASYRSTQEQLTRAEDERDSANANLEALRTQLARSRSSFNDLQSRHGELEGNMSTLAADYDDLMRQVAGLEFGPLPEAMSTQLTALAAEYPNVLTFDAKRGMLRFASDFTFDLGSTELKADAQATLGEVARILNSSTARDFEARIVGHTDNVRIAQPATLAKHPTNVHLSVHRAIAVRDHLRNAGIAPVRMQVAGYGEFRPIVENREGGAAANRRVEIFLTPMPPLAYPVGGETVTSAEPTADVAEPMK